MLLNAILLWVTGIWTNLSEVSMYFDNPESLYSVGIEFSGVSDGNNWLFTAGKDAVIIYNQLREYMQV